jgi:hypothetical protein
MTEMPQTRENQVSHQDIFDVPKITLERKLALWWQAGIRQSRARVVLRDCIGVAFLVAAPSDIDVLSAEVSGVA